MKVLWVNANFLHPTTKGGQIRTLEMLRRLHRRHEIHYAALEDPQHPEGAERAREYCYRAYPFRANIAPRHSLRFWGQVAAGVVDRLPVAIRRFRCAAMESALRELGAKERFDAAVCDFLVSAVHFPALERAVLFQHNVETIIWRRHAATARYGIQREYFRRQAERMFEFEARACRRAAQVVAVSGEDAKTMSELFGICQVTAIPTGVDIEYFRRPASAEPVADLVFVGSMDWMPNIDGMTWFFEEAWPWIAQKRPGTTVAVVGRRPPKSLERYPALITGTVADVRPYLWGSRVSIVPLRVGGGTRLKIYEAMAAGLPVVATRIGAEGLAVRDGEHLLLADTPQEFAERCLALLDDASLGARITDTAWRLVAENFSWEQVAQAFERVLERAPAYAG
jgi:glycosyltransferase involved in cell wall biosynthesis